MPDRTGKLRWASQIRSPFKKPGDVVAVVSVGQVFMNRNQNALHRLLVLKLDEHCSLIGLEGPQSLLLFGSEIVTCEIATASASTKPQSSSVDDVRIAPLLEDPPWVALLSSCSGLDVGDDNWEGGAD